MVLSTYVYKNALKNAIVFHPLTWSWIIKQYLHFYDLCTGNTWFLIDVNSMDMALHNVRLSKTTFLVNFSEQGYIQTAGCVWDRPINFIYESIFIGGVLSDWWEFSNTIFFLLGLGDTCFFASPKGSCSSIKLCGSHNVSCILAEAFYGCAMAAFCRYSFVCGSSSWWATTLCPNQGKYTL